MKYANKLVIGTLATLTALIVLLACGCSTTKLEPEGAYSPIGQQPDLAFYAADAAFDLAYSTVDAAFKFEKENRALLWKISPEIKRSLDAVRPQAQTAVVQWAHARQAYIQYPVATNMTAVEQVLQKMQQLAAAATAVLPKQ